MVLTRPLNRPLLPTPYHGLHLLRSQHIHQILVALSLELLQPSRLKKEPSNARSLGDAKASTFNPATSTTSSVTTKIADAVPISYEELKAKYDEAQAIISSYAQEGGLRMRKVAKGETSNETVNDIAQRVQETQGVPLQIAAALCLVSFLLAYLFF
jgi:hypothetical protein